MVTLLFYNFAVSRDAARRACLSATAELLVAMCDVSPVQLACRKILAVINFAKHFCYTVIRKYCNRATLC